jgi:holo-[acyl-carrier protein] synthase
MIRGVGVDVAAVSRFADVDPRHVLSAEEMTLYEAFALPARQREFLAGRFAVKEAVIKASTVVLSVKSMPEIVVLNDVHGRPFLASGQFADCRAWLSISHEKEYAVGLCILESD